MVAGIVAVVAAIVVILGDVLVGIVIVVGIVFAGIVAVADVIVVADVVGAVIAVAGLVVFMGGGVNGPLSPMGWKQLPHVTSSPPAPVHLPLLLSNT